METGTTGLTLRRARELAGMDERAGARALGITPRRLRAYEKGTAVAPVDVLSAAVAAYGGRELELPAREALLQPTEPGVLVVGSDRIPLDLVRHDNRTLLDRYLAAVRRQRGLDPDEAVAFRDTDLVVLAGVLDLSAADLDRELRALAGMSGAVANRTVRMLVLTGLAALAIGGAAAGLGGGRSTPVVGPDAPIGVEVAAVVVERAPEVQIADPMVRTASTEVATSAPTSSPFSTAPSARRDGADVWTPTVTLSPFTVEAPTGDAPTLLFSTTPSAAAVLAPPSGEAGIPGPSAVLALAASGWSSAPAPSGVVPQRALEQSTDRAVARQQAQQRVAEESLLRRAEAERDRRNHQRST